MRKAVQINLDVLSLNSGTYEDSMFRWWYLSFPLFSRYRTSEQESRDAATVLGTSDIGCYLHMTLPRSLRTSVDGVFPLIPNRWLIVRICDGDLENAKTVVMESDCPDSGGSPFLLSAEAEAILRNSPDPRRNSSVPSPVDKHTTMKSINLGKAFPLDGWKERAAGDVFLTASENGDVMFSACYFRSRNILSYFDDMADIDEAKETNVDYHVVGWLSSDESSPVYFASSTGIKWKRNSREDRANDPYFSTYDIAPVNVAIGANTNEAFLALMEQKLKHAGTADADKILTAFGALIGDYVADLKKPNAKRVSGTHRHTACFSGTDAAFRFYSDGGESKNLKRINELCALIEKLQRGIISKREQIWLDFWRCRFYDFFSVLEKRDNRTGRTRDVYASRLNPENPESEIMPLMNELEKLNVCGEELNALLKDSPNVKGGNTKRYYKPLPPSIIVSGVNSPKDIDPNFNGGGEVELHLDGDAPLLNGLPREVSAALTLMRSGDGYREPHKQPYEPIYVEWEAKYVDIPFDKWEFDGFKYSLRDGVDIRDYEFRAGSFATISGVAPLTGYFEGMVRSKLDLLGESLGATFSKDLSSMAVLSQDMAGFTEAIAQRDARPFGTPSANGNPAEQVRTEKGVVHFGNLLGFDNDEDTLSPGWFPKLRNDSPSGTPYFGMRCGGFTLNDIYIYDKFGRKSVFITSTQETGVRYSTNYPLILGDTMRGQKRYALLPPAFLMDTTLTADIALVCFLTHNIVNESFILHGKDGEYLGELAVTDGEPVWMPSEIVTNDKRIRTFIDSTVNGGLERFAMIAAQIGKSLASVGTKPANLLTAALGRPLALLDVTIAFGFFGKPYRNINWAADDAEEPEYWSYDFPFAAGDPSEREDGFVASFTKETFETMIPSGEVVSGCGLGVKNAAEFMALCVTDTYFTVRTGLLPAFTFRLPDEASLSSGIAQRLDVSNALVFANTDTEEEESGVYLPAQADGNKLSYITADGAAFPLTSGINEKSKPFISDGTVLREPKKGEEHGAI